ncbi:site-specific integrase [Robertkochia marina]|uniref:Site-specific integrase n=1 Tax=Robertkochia marina TaxID=1227945 RepID=A0A4S3M0E1_9FLAO|nr:site-specific integrase [Robertkochia marina]THD67638.1 site-specific integrase [Robertkochia marina]TRZ43371.1 site-specific integrase [Robertkochia marina]
MNQRVSFRYFIKPSKADINGLCNIYLRITIDGSRVEFSVNRKVDPARWIAKAGMVNLNNSSGQELNNYLSNIRSRLLQIHQQYINENRELTAKALRNTYFGKDDRKRMLLEVFKEHNDQVDSLIGKDFASGTAERYRTAKMHVENYIRKAYKKKDLLISKVDLKFINGFEYYLKTERNCGHNTAIKYITNFKKIIRIAIANEWIKKDPFINWNSKLKPVERDFLTEREISILLEKNFGIDRLEQVRDVFIFCCFTGLAYADVKKLNADDIKFDLDGTAWIKTRRTKTKTKSNIPLLSIPRGIISKYNRDQNKVSSAYLLPVPTNQKMNAYLKEIADLTGIRKNLSTHLARHTFATTVTLSNGVPIESVSKMLGHKNLRTTQHYAKILDQKVKQDMEVLRQKFN